MRRTVGHPPVGTVNVPVTHWGETLTIDPFGLELDRLGPANKEQRADEAGDGWIRAALHGISTTVLSVLVLGVMAAVGLVIGAYKHEAILAVLP